MGLDGESITGNSTAIAVLSATSILAGYLVLFALWYFVFRDRSGKKKDCVEDPTIHSGISEQQSHVRRSKLDRDRSRRFKRR